MMARQAQSRSTTAQVRNIADAMRKRSESMEPPPKLTQEQKHLWYAVLEARPASEWRQWDKPLLKSYVLAWGDIETLQTSLAAEGFVIETGRGQVMANPVLSALNSRLRHMSMLFERLGLALRAPVNAADAKAKANAREKAAAAVDALDEDDNLLARPND
jgi:P27 family predicted phage terminase small subunit